MVPLSPMRLLSYHSRNIYCLNAFFDPALTLYEIWANEAASILGYSDSFGYFLTVKYFQKSLILLSLDVFHDISGSLGRYTKLPNMCEKRKLSESVMHIFPHTHIANICRELFFSKLFLAIMFITSNQIVKLTNPFIFLHDSLLLQMCCL